MNIREIYQNLGMTTDLDKEIERTNNRILCLFQDIDRTLLVHNVKYDRRLLRKILHITGLDPDKCQSLEELIKKSKSEEYLQHNLEMVQVLLNEVPAIFDGESEFAQNIYEKVSEIVSCTAVHVGYIFHNGTILKSGAKELDETLIITNLEWLKKYPNSRKLFANSLEFYLRKKYPDSITNAYSALESVVKVVLNSDKAFDNDKTREELLKKLGLEQGWNQIVFQYSKIAHEESSRHGKKNQSKKDVSPELAEFYIYMTGTFLRLISQRIK